jgi:hypothetical protein
MLKTKTNVGPAKEKKSKPFVGHCNGTVLYWLYGLTISYDIERITPA